MRVTDASTAYGSLAGLQSAAARLASLQQQLSSGRQIGTPSDDPSGTVRALELRAAAKRNTQYAANSSDAIGWMSTADSAYTQSMALMQKARTLVVQALNTGSSSATSAGDLANSVANTTYNGRPVFGGTTTGTVAYNAAGSYVGDQGAVNRQVGEQSTVQINQTGTQVFGAAPNDVFSQLSAISATMRANPSALGANLTTLDGAISAMSSAQATEGAAYQRVQSAQSVQTDTGTALAGELSGIQDIDLAKTAVQVSTANVTYQAALQTTANVRQLSLLQFLR